MKLQSKPINAITAYLLLLFFFSNSHLYSQVPLTSSTNTLRHGDILCKIEVPYVEQGKRGSESIWRLPEIPDDGKESLQAINSNIDTIAIYEEGRILHYFTHGDTLTYKGQQSPRAYRIYSQERPYMRYPFQYGDSISGAYIGDCRDENEYFPVQGFGYTVADGFGSLTDGEDTLRHVTRIHFFDDLVYNYADGTSGHLVEERYMWYCAGYRYAVMESAKTSIYEDGKLQQIDSFSYLFLPYMQLALAEDEANDQLFAELAAADAARNAISQGEGVGSLASIYATLSADGRSIAIKYQLSTDSDISFYACDITGSLLGSAQYQNRAAGEWQDCLVLDHRPIGNALMLSIRCGNERISLKVSQSSND